MGLAETQPNIHVEIRTELSAVTGSGGPLSPRGIQAAGIHPALGHGHP